MSGTDTKRGGRQYTARRVIAAGVFLAAAGAVLIPWFAREKAPPVDILFDTWAGEEGPARVEALLALAAREKETEPLLEERLRSGDAGERYEGARLAGELGGTLARGALLDLALDARAPDACRAGALYALRGPALSSREKAEILETATGTGRPIVTRAALASLSGNTGEADAPALQSLLGRADPLTRVYAARLLGEQGRGPAPAFYRDLADHEDYLVRQEAYDALGAGGDPAAGPLLEKAAARETNQSAARAARLALGLHKARASGAGHDRFLKDILHNGDDDERLWALDTLKDADPALARAAVKELAAEASDFGLWCRTRLALDEKSAVGMFPGWKHNGVVHNLLTMVSLERFHAQPGAPVLDAADALRLTGALVTEDSGVKPLRHAYNPLTGRGFFGYGTFGGPSAKYMDELLAELDGAIAARDAEAALDLAGRLLHLVQDITSPLHVFGVSHPFNTCLFEDYWRENRLEVETLLNGIEIVPARPSVVPPGSPERLDAFSLDRLETRLAGISDSLRGHFEALSWLNYFTVSHWGELRFADEASAPVTLPAAFPDGSADAEHNVLHAMFAGKIRYHASWWRDYFEIEDRLGSTYAWNKCYLFDGFRPCPNPASGASNEGHRRGTVATSDGELLRVTGRFYFTQRGFSVRHCHPVCYADGVPTDMHLSRYYGAALFPLAVAHTIGWLNMLAAEAPFLFGPPADAAPADDLTGLQEKSALTRDSAAAPGGARGSAATRQPAAGETDEPASFISRAGGVLFHEPASMTGLLKALQTALAGCR